MKIRTDKAHPESRRVKPWMYVATLLVNVLVFVFIGTVYVSSNRSYSQKLFDENIHNVENLNAASANAAYTYTNSMGFGIDGIASYIQAKGLDYKETLQYLGESNTNPDWQFQLVVSGSYGDTGKLGFGDYSGVSVRKVKNKSGTLQTVERIIKYGSGYYDIFKSFTDVNDENFHGVCFAPEFTDPDTKLKCFAVYRHIVLRDGAGRRTLYTLLLAVNSRTALNAYDIQHEYQGQSTVLVNADGDYIIKNNDYRNVNFFDYIVNYNDLTLDWRERLQTEVAEGTAEAGAFANLFYKNHQGADCVFSVTAMQNGWYSITCVPLSSFRTGGGAVDYSLIILLLFLILFVVDGVAIYLVWRAMSANVSIAERATREANAANQAKSRFLSTMSHELRTPLNAIIGLVALSGDSLDDTPVLKDYLKKIDMSSRLLLQLISDILDVSAIESNKIKLSNGEFALTRLITSLSAIYYDQCAAKGVEFNVSLKNIHSETLIGDSLRLNQVLLNFLSNAVKFTPQGGKITLSAEQVDRSETSVVIKFTVSDTGCGISDELRARLFQPFERASGEAANKYSGTGLGLSIAKNITELMNGRVGVESTEGVGSSFWAEIPFQTPGERPRRSFSPIENLRVLAAIANEDERAYIGQLLTGFGVQRTLTDCAASALSLLLESQGEDKPFCLCLLDWKLPDYSGLDAAQKMRQVFDHKSLRIVVLAYDIAAASAQCADAGVDMAFGKPVFPSALYNMLEELSTHHHRPLPKPKKSYQMEGKRVLLVEDNKLNTEIAQKMLLKTGLSVETAENGQLGVNAFTASPVGYFDAILMDIRMPVMDGYQAARAIRASAHPQAKTVPILAMTADAFTDDVEKTRQAGMDEHIAKPVAPEALYAILKKYMN